MGCGGDGGSEPSLTDEWVVGKTTVMRIHNIPRKQLFYVDEFYKGDPCPVHMKQLGPECTVVMQYEDGRTQSITYEWDGPGASEMKHFWTGTSTFRLKPMPSRTLMTHADRKSMRHSVRQAVHVFEVEHQILQNGTTSTSPLTSLRMRPRIDLLETFAGQAGISRRAARFGLKSMEPIDYNTGYDLERPQHQRHVDHLIDSYKPLFLLQGLECKDWCLLQDNVNYVRRKIILLMRRARARKLLRKVVDWCCKQAKAGRYFLLENPVTSRLWLEPLILRLLRLPGVYAVVCHSGAYGATNSKGDMIKKGFKFLGNCPLVLDRLTRKLEPHLLRQCVPLEGKETTLSQHYPDNMIREILIGIKQTAAQQDPERFFGHQHKSNFQVMAVTTEPSDWAPVFESARKTFDTIR